MSQTRADTLAALAAVHMARRLFSVRSGRHWSSSAARLLTVVAEAVGAGTGGALVHVDFAARAGEASATAAAEARRETLRVQLLHTHAAVLARVVGLAGQVLAIWTLSRGQKNKKMKKGKRTRLRTLQQMEKKANKQTKTSVQHWKTQREAFYRLMT